MQLHPDWKSGTNADLVVLHNNLVVATGVGNQLKSWKRSKDLLVSKVEALVDRLPPGEEKPRRTIRATALELLCRTEYHEDRGRKPGPDNRAEADSFGARSVGLPYDRIIAEIRNEFPDCETTVACLRWYAVKVRVEEAGYEGLRLPQRRPRARART
jgi:hypothetical protein